MFIYIYRFMHFISEAIFRCCASCLSSSAEKNAKEDDDFDSQSKFKIKKITLLN